ncbi:uncharacterized protein LOC110033870 isoform X3 [Phalaenopsis equestris]|uniref:uncharacterized protein LOC110033870 isoform X3 n=1 Tax=Phalaenopsis equestris TaxID=78828 RepID=UPI0009E36BFD|nr:uncharacterized protein LOC110033870 isoform X3 [Phalaenopsis equestris]
MRLTYLVACSPSLSSFPSDRRSFSPRKPRFFPRAEMSLVSQDGHPPLAEKIVVLGCGALSADYLATVDAFPKPDDKIRSTSLKIANDFQGKNILTELEGDGVDTSFIVVSEGNSPFTYIIVDNETKTRTCIHTPGYPPMMPNDLSNSKLCSALDDSSLVYLDGRLHETALAVAQEATQRKIPILVDAERKREGLDDLLNLATYVVCSEKFPQAWTSGPSIPNALAAMLLSLPNIKFVIVTRGYKGCIMLERSIDDTCEAEEMEIGSLLESLMQKADWGSIIPTCISSKMNIRIRADEIGSFSGRLLVGTAEVIPPSELIDTTGAGDAFIGAILYALCVGMAEKMLPFASLVAAAGCRALGARSGLPWRTDPRLAPFLRDSSESLS